MNYLIKNVTLFTGTKLVELQNVLIENSKITKVTSEEIINENCEHIDGKGFILSPGFIDVHTHSDLDVALTDSQNLLSQGVTTVVGGNCGISCGNVNNKSLEGIVNPNKFDAPQFTNIQEYWKWISTQKIAVNYASLVGHHTLIEEAGNNMEKACEDLERHINEGFLGLSTGLVYGWGEKVEKSEDLIPLAKILSKYNAIIATHVKDQSEGLYDSVKMFTDLWETGECENLKIQISHLKHMLATDPNGSKTLEKTLDLIEAYYPNKDIAVDIYPYTAGATSLSLKDRYKQCLNGWEDVFPFGLNKSINEISKEQNLSPEIVVENILKEDPKILAVYKNSCREEDMLKIISKPYAMIASDGLPTHPRHWGTFTKVIRYALDNNLNLEEYLSKMTDLPAKQFGLKGIGQLVEGSLANLTLFDPATIRDTATYENPESPSQGIIMVWVNGEIAFKEGRVIKRNGKILKRL